MTPQWATTRSLTSFDTLFNVRNRNACIVTLYLECIYTLGVFLLPQLSTTALFTEDPLHLESSSLRFNISITCVRFLNMLTLNATEIW